MRLITQAWLNKFERFGERWYAVSIILGLFFLIIFSPGLLGGKMFFDSELLTYHYSYYSFHRQSLQNGESFLWNPYSSSGYPSFVGATSHLISPITYLSSLFLEVPYNFNWLLFFYILLAVFFTDLFLSQALKIGFWGRLVGSLIFVGSVLFFNLHIAYLAPVYAMSLLLLCCWKIKEGRNFWPYILFGGVGLGFSWMSSFSGFIIQALIVFGLFALVLGWGDWRSTRRLLAACVLIVVVGAIISSFYIYWASVFAGLSDRAGGLSYGQAAIKATSLFDLPRFWLPHFKINYFAISQATLYIGFLPLFFLIFSFFNPKKQDRLYYFFLFLYVGMFLLTIQYSPLFWLIQKLPVLNFFKVPSRWMFAGSFGGAVLVADMIHRIYNSREKFGKPVFKWFQRINLLILFLILAISSVFAFGYGRIFAFFKKVFLLYVYPRTSQVLTPEHYYRLIDNFLFDIRGLFDLGSARVFWPIVFIVLGLALLWLYFVKNLTSKRFIRLAGFFTILNFFFVLLYFHPTFDSNLVKSESPTVTFLKENRGKFLPFLITRPPYEYADNARPSVDQQVKMELLTLNSDTQLHYGLESADNADPLLNRRMVRLLGALGGGGVIGEENLSDLPITPEERARIFEKRKPLLDWLGVRYVITAYALERPFAKVFEVDSPPPYKYPMFIYENSGYRPLAYFADKIDAIGQDEQAVFQKMLSSESSGFDILECDADCPSFSDAPLSDEDSIEIKGRKNNEIILTAKSSEDRLLVLLQNNVPGWKVEIDGSPARIFLVNSTFIGVSVSEGTHQIRAVYDPSLL